MKPDAISEIQAELDQTVCPSCKENKLNLLLRCDLGQEECLFVAKCQKCGSNYSIAAPSKTLASHRAMPEDLLLALTCDHCRSHKTELHFQCELGSRSCFYQITCQKCGGVVREYR